MTASNRKVVEAILLLAEEPLSASQIGEVLERPRTEVAGLLQEMAQGYQDEDRGFVLRESACGWRLYSSPDCAPWLERFATRRDHGRMTGAALEVLAIVAYRGPIARSEIAEIRGVGSDGVVRTLLNRGLIREQGRDEGPGSPVLFAVSDEFMERMGLRSLEELPSLADFMPDTDAVEDMEAKLSPGV